MVKVDSSQAFLLMDAQTEQRNAHGTIAPPLHPKKAAVPAFSIPPRRRRRAGLC